MKRAERRQGGRRVDVGAMRVGVIARLASTLQVPAPRGAALCLVVRLSDERGAGSRTRRLSRGGCRAAMRGERLGRGGCARHAASRARRKLQKVTALARERERVGGPARTLRLRRVFLLAMGVTVTSLAVAAYQVNLLRSLDLSTVNTRFSIRGTQKPPKKIVLVLIDPTTLNQLKAVSWPFPRTADARVIDNVRRDRPAAVELDEPYSEPSSCPATAGNPFATRCPQAIDDEAALFDALSNANAKVVLAIAPPSAVANTTNGEFEFLIQTLKRGSSQAHADRGANTTKVPVPFLGSSEGSQLLAQLDVIPASAVLPHDPDSVIRRMLYAADGLPTLAVAVAKVVERHEVSRDAFGGSNGAWVDYAGPAGTFAAIPYSTVYFNRVPRGFFHDKIVVIGPSAPSLGDVESTSTSARMPGAEVQANAIETVLRGLPLRSAGGWLDIALIVLLGMAMPLAGLRIGALATIILATVLATAFLVGVQVAFDDGHVVTVVYPLAALLVSTAGALAVHARNGFALARSSVASLAVDKQQLQGELRARISELEQSRSRMLDVSRREREGIERDLHDGAQQRFVSLAITLGLLERRLSDRLDGGPLLASAREQLDLGLAELRELARGIHPAVLTDGGLAPAIEALAARAPLQVDVLEVPERRLPANVEAAIYYIVAESLTNSAKHARADAASVRITHDHLNATVEVSDDGVGGADPTHGSGLRGLADRAAAVDGQLTVDSPHGAGTRIHAKIPCT